MYTLYIQAKMNNPIFLGFRLANDIYVSIFKRNTKLYIPNT